MKSICTYILLLLSTAAYSQGADWEWVVSGGGLQADHGTDQAIDAAGNIYVTGQFSNTLSIGPYSVSSQGNTDIFIAKFDMNGQPLWLLSEGGTGEEIAGGLALDSAGNLYVCGAFTTAITLGGTTYTGNGEKDIMLMKYDANGNMLWSQTWGGSQWDVAADVEISSDAKIYLTGYFTGAVNFGISTLSSTGICDILLMKLDTSGSVNWVRKAGGGSIASIGWHVSAKEKDRIYTCGFSGGTMISFGNNVILSQTDMFVACYDSAGYAQWARGAETQDIYPMYGTSVASSPTGYVYTVGFTFEDQDLLFGNTLLSGHNAYIAKYSPAGTLQWVKGIASNSTDLAEAVTVDENSNIYVSGHFSSLAIFGNDTVGSAGGDDIMVVKLDSNGNNIWWKTAGGTGGDASYSLAADNNGFVYLTGYIGSAPANFGPYSASTTGGRDMYLAKLSQTTGLPVTAGQNEELRAYPNPCYEELWLSGAATQTPYRITDITGRQIADGEVQNGRIDVLQLPPGLYILTLPEGRVKFVKR